MSTKNPLFGYHDILKPEGATHEQDESLFPEDQFKGGAAAQQHANPASHGYDAGGKPSANGLGGMFPDGVDPSLLQPADAGVPQSDPAGDIAPEVLALLCRERICPVCPVKKEADDSRLRAMADLDNARKRLAREKEDLVKFASEAVLSDLLPALDNLALALQHAPTDEHSKNFVVGVDMTRNLLLEALKKHGLEEVGALGDAFDPALHEAVGMSDAPEIAEDHVCSLLSRGYSLHGRLLRPAKVVVCRRTPA